MECLQYLVCFSCYKELGSDEDVLMCGKCEVWQHFKCTKDVSGSFYSQFYLAVLQDQKPAHWQCQYCTSHDHTATTPQMTSCPTKAQRKVTPLVIPNNPVPSLADSSDNDQEDELNMAFDLSRTGREGPAYHATSQSSLETKTLPIGHKVLLKPRPVFLDPSPLPTTYSLIREASGQKVAKDCHGNIFKTTGVITDKAESYQCAHAGCQFEVRVCETIREFLCGGKSSKEEHNHSMPSSSASSTDSSDSHLARPAKRHKPAAQPSGSSIDSRGSSPVKPPIRPFVLRLDSSDSSSDSSAGDLPSLTPYNTPAKPARMSAPAAANISFTPFNTPAKPTRPSVPARPAVANTNIPPRPAQTSVPARPSTAKTTTPARPAQTCIPARPATTNTSIPARPATAMNSIPSRPAQTSVPARPATTRTSIPAAKPSVPVRPPAGANSSIPSRPAQTSVPAATTNHIPARPTQLSVPSRTVKPSQTQTKVRATAADPGIQDRTAKPSVPARSVSAKPGNTGGVAMTVSQTASSQVQNKAATTAEQPMPQLSPVLPLVDATGTTRSSQSVVDKVSSKDQMKTALRMPRLSPIILRVDTSHTIPRIIKTPAKPRPGKRTSYCSDTTDGSDTEDLQPYAIHRFQPLTTPNIRKSLADYSFSSSDSSDSNDDLNITNLCDALSDNSDLDLNRAPADLEMPPSPSDTIPACHSSDSEDDEDNLETSPILTYNLSEGTASGAKSRLTDSLGYTYQIKFKLGTRVFWTCTEKVGRCSATVIQQRRDQFTRGAASHNHESSQSPTSSSPASEPATSPSQATETSTHTVPTSQLATCTSQSDARYQKSAANKQRTSATASVPAHKGASDEMQPGKPTTTNQSRVARIVKSTAPPTASRAPPTRPTAEQPGQLPTFQEITTCAFYSYRPQSFLIDSDGYVYRNKTEDEKRGKTVWKCTQQGPDGKCKGKVVFSFIREFNDRLEVEDYNWQHQHDTSLGDIRLVATHNHEPSRKAAVTLKLKAMIHREIYGWGHHNSAAATVIKDATAQLSEHERAQAPQGKDPVMKTLKNYVWKVQREYRDEPRAGMERYMLDRDFDY